MVELGGFAENKNVVNGFQRDYESFNFCLAEEYLCAMGAEDWSLLGQMGTDLINNIAFWLNYDGAIGKDRIEIIKNIPHGLIMTYKGRTFIDAVVEEHKADLAETFILNGNHDVRLYLTAIFYGQHDEYDNNLLNNIHNSFEHSTVERYTGFLKEIFKGIDSYYNSITDMKEQGNFLIKIKPFIKGVRIPVQYKDDDNLKQISRLDTFEWQKCLKKSIYK